MNRKKILMLIGALILVITLVSCNNKKIDIIFYDNDSETILEVINVKKGEIPNPRKPPNKSDDEYTYIFEGWDRELDKSKKDDFYIARYKQEKNVFEITFYDGDILLETIRTSYGIKVEPKKPTKESTNEYDYEFIGWDFEIEKAKENKSYFAVFKNIPKQYKIYYYINNEIYYEDIFSYNDSVTTIKNPDIIGYDFIEWDKELPENMPANDIYIFGKLEKRIYELTFYIDSSMYFSIKLEYNTKVDLEFNSICKEGYNFSGWDKKIPTNMPAENLKFYGSFEIRKYIISFIDYESKEILYKKVYEHGSEIELKSLEDRENDYYNFKFSHWTEDFELVKNDKDYFAVFDKEIKNFTIEYVLYKGISDDENKYTYNYENNVVFVDAKKNGFHFLGWYLDDDYSKEIKETNGLYGDLVIHAKWYFSIIDIPLIDLDTKDIEISYGSRIPVSVFVRDELNVSQEIEGEIKGRGNSTWSFDKKPYQLKFNDRIDLLGLNSAKKFVLLADYTDKTLLRNYFAFEMAKMMNFEYTIQTKHINVILNNEYIGVYLLSEQVEIDKNKLNIELDDSIDGSFFIEMDGRAKSEGYEDIHWFETSEMLFAFKDMDLEDYSDDISKGKISYIKMYIDDLINSFEKGDYLEYIDLEHFIDFFIVQEIMKNADVGFSSIFLYKRKDEKLKFGPLWDFDLTLGNYEGNTIRYPEGFYAQTENIFLMEAVKNKSFLKSYYERFTFVIDNILPQILVKLEKEYDLILESTNINFIKWDILDKNTWPHPPYMQHLDTYEKQFEYLLDYVNVRKNWLKAEMGLILDKI